MKQSPPALCSGKHALLEMLIGSRSVLVWCPACGRREEWRPVLAEEVPPNTPRREQRT